MLNDSTQPTANGLFKSNSLTTNKKFDLTVPTKIIHLKYSEASFTKILNQEKIHFEFSHPIKIPINVQSTKPVLSVAQSTPRTHVVLVDQAAFSVFKSVKSQERTLEEKTDNKLVVINSNRNHPYNNSIRPSDLRTGLPAFQLPESSKPPQSTISLTKNTETDISEIEPNSSESIQICESSVPQAGTKINRNSSSNAILAQIKSLGPTFKSIFVRPKNTKHIDSSILNKSTGASNKINIRQNNFDYKELLKQSFLSKSSDSSFDDSFIRSLPAPKELKVDQSVDEILQKLSSQENNSLSKKSPLSKAASSSKQLELDHQSQTEKWTCMVCLSKHLEKVDICSICGSSRPESKHKALSQSISFCKPVCKTSSKCSLLDRESNEPKSHKSDDILSLLQDDEFYYKKSLFTSKPNPYIKKWTCHHCNYSNDSLKIVCLNCRWVKTAPLKSKQRLILNETLKTASKSHLTESAESEIPVKKSRPNEESNNLAGQSKQQKSTESQQESLASIFAKSSSNKWTCGDCLTQNDQSKAKCVCCDQVRPGKKIEEASKESLASLFAKSSANKWTCGSCFTQNDDSKVKCVCCEVDRPDGRTEKQPKEPEAQKESLASIFAKSSSNKWTCGDCLTQNDQSKAKCVCCDQVRPGAKVEDASKTQVPVSTGGFSFGLCANDSSVAKPSFSSSFGVGNGGFSFKPLTEAKSATQTKEIDKQDKKEQSSFQFAPFSQDKSKDSENKTNDKSTGFSFAPLTTAPQASSKTDLSSKPKDSQSKEFSLPNTFPTKSSADILSKDKNPAIFSLFDSQTPKLPNGIFGSESRQNEAKNGDSFSPFTSSNFSSKSDTKSAALSTEEKKNPFSPFGSQTSSGYFGSEKNQNESKNSNTNLFGTPSLSSTNFNFSSAPKPAADWTSLSASTAKPTKPMFGSSSQDPSVKSDSGLFSQALNCPSTEPFFSASKNQDKTDSSPFVSNLSGGIFATSSTTSTKAPSGLFGQENKDKKESSIFPSFGTSTANPSSALFGKESNAPSQIVENNKTSSFGSTSGLFANSTNNNLNAPFGSSNQAASFGLLTKAQPQSAIFSAPKSTGPFESSNSPFGEKKIDTGLFGAKNGGTKRVAESPFGSQSNSVNSMASPLNFTSTPTSTATNLALFGSAISTNTTLYPTPEMSNQKNALFGPESSGKRGFFGDTSPNNSFGLAAAINAERPAFSSDFLTQPNTPVNGQSNNQGFNFGQNMDINLNFSKSNSNELIQFSGSNEQPKEAPQRRYSKARRRFK
ncbi:nuclear pore complex protein Nup153-like [Brachionus plicatilis]|uniref:Nuclear pore complex protein Nup153 n=1 Tax=Brachionus plicatilis TaxID=10195 RepID=A0A3M7SH88_BRAPC|nr:nuclear pore complex protein Nup153-like [Brachionus plicatilis]